MNKTTPPGRAKLSRSSAETTDPFADKLRRYDDHLRDVRDLAAGTRRDRCRIVGQLFPELSGARFAYQLSRGFQIMWSSKSTPTAPHEQWLHDTGRGYT